MDVHVPSLDITSIISVSCIREKIHFTNLDLSFYPEDFRTELIHINTNDNQSKETNPEEQDLCRLTRRNMKRLSPWDEWEQG